MGLSTTFFRSGIRLPSAATPREGSVFAVGRRVLVKCATVGTPVPVTDASGSKTVAVLRDGTEVEILGWKPRAAGGAPSPPWPRPALGGRFARLRRSRPAGRRERV